MYYLILNFLWKVKRSKRVKTGIKKLFIGLVLFSISRFSGVCSAKKIKVKNATQELPEVVVTATRTEKEVEIAPASVNVVTKEKIELKNPKTIDETLNDIPGVMVRRGKGLLDTLAFITLRGVPKQQRTLIMMDGIILNAPYTGIVRFGGYFPEDLEKVEVVKGPFSSLYGGYAMGGVVNFITEMPEKREIVLKTGYGSSFDRGDAMDDLKRVYFSYGDKIANRFSFFVSYGRHDTEGYPTKFVTRSSPPLAGISGYERTYDCYGELKYLLGDTGDNRWWDDSITLKAQYEFNKNTKLRLTFMRNRYEYNYDKPHTYLYNIVTMEPVYYPKEKYYLTGPGGRIQNIYALNFETLFLNKIKTKLNISYFDVEEDWYVSVGSRAKITGCPPGTNPKYCGYISNTPQNAFTADLQFTLPIFNNQILTFGGFYRREYANTKEKYLTNWKDEDSTVSLKYQSKGKTRTFAFYIQDEIALRDNLTAYIGFRQDWWKTWDGYVNQVGIAGYPKEYESNSESSFSPKFAIVYKPFKRTILRGSIGKAFRPPTVYDLYRTWTSSWSGITYAGNPNLSPETLTAYDIGIEQKFWKGAKIFLTYFHNYFDDLIYRKTVNATYQEYINVGKAETQGVETGFEQKFDFGLKFFANFTYTDSEVKENKAKPETEGKRLTYTPLWMGNIGVEFKKGKWSFYIIGRYMDKWYSDDMNKDKKSGVYGSYDEYFVVDMRVNYQINKWMSLSVSGDNIFDRDYYQYYKAPGASWFAELSIKF
ncbi:MAG: TonB-dependent receptor [Thermodesulfobacteriota bacterium]|nr:MAG: TonB-dependent receptor [Thermodesulfobacteriota bacterium]